jgi:predicted small secreted protein
MKSFKRLLKCGIILSFAVILPACNTVHGAGKDIERGGEKLQDASGK